MSVSVAAMSDSCFMCGFMVSKMEACSTKRSVCSHFSRGYKHLLNVYSSLSLLIAPPETNKVVKLETGLDINNIEPT